MESTVEGYRFVPTVYEYELVHIPCPSLETVRELAPSAATAYTNAVLGSRREDGDE